jgi:hypothetical protein
MTEEKKCIYEDDYLVKMRESLSPEDKEKYRKIGENMYNSVDYLNPETSIHNAFEYIICGLKSGLDPDELTESEKLILKNKLGDNWEKKIQDIHNLKY